MATETATPGLWHQRALRFAGEGRHFIGGALSDSQRGETFEIVNPADGRRIAAAARGRDADVDRAVAAARAAFVAGDWSRCAPRDRLDVLYRFAALVERDGESLALMDTLSMGMPIAKMIDVEVPEAAAILRYFGEAIDKFNGRLTNTAPEMFHVAAREPYGVVGAVSPWNFPLTQAVNKIAPALAAGNSLVLKPAEEAPLSAVHLARLFVEAGGPAGVFNVVCGLGEEAGKALALHDDVDKISFTGSTRVGRLMMIYSAQSNLKKVSAELGGKSPQIILQDVPDLDRAVEAAIDGIYGNAGQVCNAGSRLLVQRPLLQEVIERFRAWTPQRWLPGDPLAANTQLGPLVSRAAQQRVLGEVGRAVDQGVRVEFGGCAVGALPTGAYMEPTLLSGVDNAMPVAREEIFGPVAAIMAFDSAEEALAIANDSPFGLAASIWTRDISRALQMARAVQAGVVWVNCFNEGDMTMPWGGYKQSGNARESNIDALLEYTQVKSIRIRL